MAEPSGNVGAVRIFVYHQCAVAATGSALGPYGATSYWWLDGAGIRIVGADGLEAHRHVIEQAIGSVLGIGPDAVRQRQDELAEAPEL